jgi:hypothetical protein
MSKLSFLHEVEFISFTPERPRKVLDVVKFLRTAAFTVAGDVCYLKRKEKIPLWQHSATVEVKFFWLGEEQFDFRSNWDRLHLEYLFASLPQENTAEFVSRVEDTAAFLKLPPLYQGMETSREAIERMFATCADDLRRELGESPGSESLAIYIQGTYPR